MSAAVHHHPLAWRVVAALVQLLARDSGGEQVGSQDLSELAFVAEASDDVALATALPEEGLEQRQQRGLDRERSARALRFRCLVLTGDAVDAVADLDRLACEIDIVPAKRLELSGTEVAVDGDRVVATPEDRDYAENQAARQIPMKMADWVAKLDAFLHFNEYEVLASAGRVSAEVAKRLTEEEYDKFRVRQDRAFESDFEAEVKRIESKRTPNKSADS